jgi:hypothetical protein
MFNVLKRFKDRINLIEDQNTLSIKLAGKNNSGNPMYKLFYKDEQGVEQNVTPRDKNLGKGVATNTMIQYIDSFCALKIFNDIDISPDTLKKLEKNKCIKLELCSINKEFDKFQGLEFALTSLKNQEITKETEENIETINKKINKKTREFAYTFLIMYYYNLYKIQGIKQQGLMECID